MKIDCTREEYDQLGLTPKQVFSCDLLIIDGVVIKGSKQPAGCKGHLVFMHSEPKPVRELTKEDFE